MPYFEWSWKFNSRSWNYHGKIMEFYFILFVGTLILRPAKSRLSLGIRPVWSESSLSIWGNLWTLATHWAHSRDSDQTDLPRLIDFVGSTGHFVGFVVCRLKWYQLLFALCSDLRVRAWTGKVCVRTMGLGGISHLVHGSMMLHWGNTIKLMLKFQRPKV